MAKHCNACEQCQNMPKQAGRGVAMYTMAENIHMYLVVVEAHSKWPEVIMTKSTTSEGTVEILRTIFARNGLPEQLISVNGPQLVSAELKELICINGIRHTTSALYHPANNGLDEQFVHSSNRLFDP